MTRADPPPSRRASKAWLDLAAVHALRGEGHVEPGVMVGCVIVPASESVEIESLSQARGMAAAMHVGLGHHRAFGGPHAEVEAIEACRRLGIDTKDATAFVTLEPCNHWGKTGPCSEALLKARVSRVICARADDTETSAGGAEKLRRDGVDVHFTDVSPNAIALSDAFFFRVRSGLPWVIAKWAQTLDGKSATSTGESQWLTGPRARRAVHRLRGRVDAILTGVGTVLADDPLLTPRNVSAPRYPMRVVIDPKLETPTDAKLLRTARESPVLIVCSEGSPRSEQQRIEKTGAHVLRYATDDGVIDLREVLSTLARDEGVSTVMTEGGPRLMGRLLDAGVINEMRAYLAPMVIGDASAPPAFLGRSMPKLEGVERWRLIHSRSLGNDTELRYRRSS